MKWPFFNISNISINANVGKKNSINNGGALSGQEKPPAAEKSLPPGKTLFISHSSKDKAVVDPFVKMLLDAGFPRKTLFYSSDPALGVPPGENIPDYLRRRLSENAFVIFMLSGSWCGSAVCENEMGAAWYGDLKRCNVLLPGFHYSDIKDVASPSEMSIRYDDSVPALRDKLGQLRKLLEKHFALEFADSAWERSREQFLSSIQSCRRV